MNDLSKVEPRIILATSVKNMENQLSATDIAFSKSEDFIEALRGLNILDLTDSQRQTFVCFLKRADTTIVDNQTLLDKLVAARANVPERIRDAEAFARWGAKESDLGDAMSERLLYLSREVGGQYSLGEFSGAKRAVAAIGRATDPRLRGLTFVGENQSLHKAARTSSPARRFYEAPKQSQAQGHAEDALLNQFNNAIERAGIPKDSVSGQLNIMVDHPTGVCGSCKSGLGGSAAAPGVIVQASRDYPNLTFTFITRSQNRVEKFSVKNGVRAGTGRSKRDIGGISDGWISGLPGALHYSDALNDTSFATGPQDQPQGTRETALLRSAPMPAQANPGRANPVNRAHREAGLAQAGAGAMLQVGQARRGGQDP